VHKSQNSAKGAENPSFSLPESQNIP